MSDVDTLGPRCEACTHCIKGDSTQYAKWDPGLLCMHDWFDSLTGHKALLNLAQPSLGMHISTCATVCDRSMLVMDASKLQLWLTRLCQ